jgi:tetratricopeptide (TPR) repeat protein
MDSPTARPPGDFSWQATLWHELAHVITLQLSNQRVPRWLTEGISVYEEREAREAWGREGEMTFVRALGAGRTIPLPDLNAAFSDPERISLAYFQASLLVEHLVERFGAAKLKALVEAYRTALDPAAPIAPVLGEDLAGLQPSFDAFIERRYGLAREAMVVPEGFEGALASAGTEVGALARLADAHAGSYAAQLAVGEVLVGAGANDEARRVLDRALPLMPLPTGTIPARNLLAEVSVRQGDAERAKVELEAVLAADGTALDAARRLAELSQAPEDGPRMRRAAERIIAVNPFDALPHAMLGKLALAAGDLDTALREFRVALDAGPSDLAAAHTDLAVTYFRAGRVTDAKQSAIAALEIAPRYEKAQELLLSIVDKR